MTPSAQAWEQFHHRGWWMFHGDRCPHCPCFIRDEQSAAWGFVLLVRTRDPISTIRRATAT